MPLQFEDSKWKDFKTKVRARYSKIKDYEIETTRGRIELLAKKIRCLYKNNKIEPEIVLEEYAKETKLLK